MAEIDLGGAKRATIGEVEGIASAPGTVARAVPVKNKVGGDNLVEAVAEGIPSLACEETDRLVAEYGLKDSAFSVHVYHRVRKEVLDTSMSALAESQGQSAHLIMEEANRKFEEIPWWPDFEELLVRVVTEHFKPQDVRITFYREVDSWSVLMPEPRSPLACSPGNIRSFLAKLELQLGAK